MNNHQSTPSTIVESDSTYETKSKNYLEVNAEPTSVPSQLLITKDAQKNYQKPVMNFDKSEFQTLKCNIQTFMDQVKSGSDQMPESVTIEKTNQLVDLFDSKDFESDANDSDDQSDDEQEQDDLKNVQVEMNLFLVEEEEDTQQDT